MKRRRYRVKLLVSFAALWLLAACSGPEPPPFEVRNELDQLVVDFFWAVNSPILKEVVAEREARGGVAGATRQFLGEAFPQGTPQATVIEYFVGIGGSCRSLEQNERWIICEYCRNRNSSFTYFFATSYSTQEYLWIVEIVDTDASQSPDKIPVTDALAFAVARGARPSNDHSGPAVEPYTCDNAKYLYETHQGRDPEYRDIYGYGDLMKRHWVYGEVE